MKAINATILSSRNEIKALLPELEEDLKKLIKKMEAVEEWSILDIVERSTVQSIMGATKNLKYTLGMIQTIRNYSRFQE